MEHISPKKPSIQRVHFFVVFSLAFLVFFALGIIIPRLFSDSTNKYSGEQKQFAEYALLIADVDLFENPLRQLFIQHLSVEVVTDMGFTSSGNCAIYDVQGKDIFLKEHYVGTVRAYTLFGLPFGTATVRCQ